MEDMVFASGRGRDVIELGILYPSFFVPHIADSLFQIERYTFPDITKSSSDMAESNLRNFHHVLHVLDNNKYFFHVVTRSFSSEKLTQIWMLLRSKIQIRHKRNAGISVSLRT